MVKKHFLIGLLVVSMGLVGAVLPALAQDDGTTDQGTTDGQTQQNGTETPEGAPETGHGWAASQ